MTTQTIPTVWDLTRAQRDGTHCVWCGRPLDDNAVLAGIAVGYWGPHNLSVAVYQCPDTKQGDTPWQSGPAPSPPKTSHPAPAASPATAGPRTPRWASTAATP